MLSPPHADGDVGAVRVELRGRVGSAREIRILGAVERPSIGAAAVIGAAVDHLQTGAVTHGVRSLMRGAALNLSNMENFEAVTGAAWLDVARVARPRLRHVDFDTLAALCRRRMTSGKLDDLTFVLFRPTPAPSTTPS